MPCVRWLWAFAGPLLPATTAASEDGATFLKAMEGTGLSSSVLPMSVLEILGAGHVYEVCVGALLGAAPSNNLKQPSANIASITATTITTTPTTTTAMAMTTSRSHCHYLTRLVEAGLLPFSPSLCESISEMLADVEPFYEVSSSLAACVRACVGSAGYNSSSPCPSPPRLLPLLLISPPIA